MKQIILASQSPRRKELLEKCGVSFTVEAADIDEAMDLHNDLKEEIQKLAYRKAYAVLQKHPDAVVIGSDTIVVLNNEVLGKPADRNDAVRMLRELSGNTHQVITGVCITGSGKTFTDVSVSDVTFAQMTDEEITAYAESGEADDKAGAYGIQGLAARYITHIAGDYYSIMGLPVSMVYNELKNLSQY